MLLIFNPAYGPLANNAETLGYIGVVKNLRLTMEEEQQAETS
jgi:hypothetical protein